MQQPRRTYELHEEPSSKERKQSRRAASPSTGNTLGLPGTAQKYGSRPSRIAMPTRNSNADRGGAASMLTRPSSSERGGAAAMRAATVNSAMRSRVTPQKTPVGKLSATRALFTAEKQRPGGLHNDKKWVNDQIHRVASHLERAVMLGQLPGFGAEFFARPNNLRQMSIKQFVAVINYFLRYICGNRFTVGANHVEDIVNALQKLNYPHQVNKSWLKTPNTQHSFGNVMVLLDFLMDFVPPVMDEEHQETGFNLLVQEEAHGPLQAPDAEFQSQMVNDAEEGFPLWDKQLTTEYLALQLQTCDSLIVKVCGVKGAEALKTQLEELNVELLQLAGQCPKIPKEQQTQHHQLEEEMRYASQQLEMLHDDLNSGSEKLRQLEMQHEMRSNEMKKIKSDISRMESAMKKQTCSRSERDKLMEETSQLKHMLRSQERTLLDLNDRNLLQEVLLSRAKKELTDKIQKFNDHMRKIAYAQILPDSKPLQLPLRAEPKHLQNSVALLNQLRKKTDIAIEETRKQQKHLSIAKLSTHADMELLQKSCELSAAVSAAQKYLAKYEQQEKHESSKRLLKQQELTAQIQEIEFDISRREEVKHQALSKLKSLDETLEAYLSAAEKEHEAKASARHELLDACEAKLDAANAELDAVLEDMARKHIGKENASS